MKNIILLLLLSLIGHVARSQSQINLETLTFNENVKQVLQGKKSHLEKRELRTTLPEYVTEEIQYFSYGPVSFGKKSDGGFSGTVSLMLKSLTSKKIVGFHINIAGTAQAKKLAQYLKTKYGKAEILSPEPTKPDHGFLIGNAVCVWRDFRPNRTIILAQAFLMEGNQQAQDVNVYLLESDLKPVGQAVSKTVVNRVATSWVP